MDISSVVEQAQKIGVSLVSSPRLLDRDSNRSTWRVEGQGQSYFLKLSSQVAAVEAEVHGLALMRKTGAIRVPEVFLVGRIHDGGVFALLEWMDFGPSSPRSNEYLGHAIATMHRGSTEKFGLDKDNFIGASPQRNVLSEDWPAFFRDYRLGVQLSMAASNGLDDCLSASVEKILENIACFFSGPVEASLLHGDLWGGNWGSLIDDQPVVFDPACYFGHREADIAMTELFGGFSREFYDAYSDVWPLSSGYAMRKHLYNLYHVLNHYNLFGSAYLGQVTSLISRVKGFI